jgi:glycosyltransferase involved in cell wall biosynthesis
MIDIFLILVSFMTKIIFIIFFILSIQIKYGKYFPWLNYQTNQSSSDFYKDIRDKKKALRKGKKYFKYCLDDILINKQYFKKNIIPLVSVVIPVYSAQSKIRKAIRSIQNQKMTDLEIILIDDFSNDDSVNVIKSLQEKDERIILIKNKKNRGIFYTRCIGTLKAKGKYIFPLDNDDLFFDEDVIDIIFNEANKGNYDIVEFNYAEYYNLRIPPKNLISTEFGNHSHNLILNQPELGQFPRKKNNTYGVFDCFVWAKCIKTKIYKKSINKIGNKIYSKFILRGEDFIMTFVLFRIASSFKFFGKYGIFRYKSFSTATFQSSRELYLLSRIIYLDIILKFTENNFEDKLYVVFFAEIFLKTLSEELDVINKKNKIYFKKVFHKLLNNKYIDNISKTTFISYFKNFSWIFNK